MTTIRAACACLAFASAMALAQAPADLKSVRDKVAQGQARLLDVREEDEWKEGHLKNATLVPLTRITKGLDAKALADLKGKPVFTHCRAGIRAQKAAALLKSLGVDATPIKAGYDELEAIFGKGK